MYVSFNIFRYKTDSSGENTIDYTYQNGDPNGMRKKSKLVFHGGPGVAKMKNVKPMNSNTPQLSAEQGSCKWFMPSEKQNRPVVLQCQRKGDNNILLLKPADTNGNKHNDAEIINENLHNEIPNGDTSKAVSGQIAQATTDEKSQSDAIQPFKKRKRDVSHRSSPSLVDQSPSTPIGKRMRKENGDSSTVSSSDTPGSTSKETPTGNKEGRKRSKTGGNNVLHIKCCNPECKIWRKVCFAFFIISKVDNIIK